MKYSFNAQESSILQGCIPLYEGKAKILFKDPSRSVFFQYFKDDITAFNKEKVEIVENKGILNNLLSTYLFQKLEKEGIPTHLIEKLGDRIQKIRGCRPIPLEIVVRNIAAGSLIKRYGLQKGQAMDPPCVEFFYKNDALGDPLCNEDHIVSLGWISSVHILHDIKTYALQMNQYLRELFESVNVCLVDFKVEFGHSLEDGKLLLIDEISSDSCRLWDRGTLESFDKDIFRYGKEGLSEKIWKGYGEIIGRLGLREGMDRCK